ncbi:uncharacterized protein [Argopecten irradians]|uniref:uncharacterized protein n=1 Tax=Argopecten irradians TaxID=31199 RepID=UPI003721AC8C
MDRKEQCLKRAFHITVAVNIALLLVLVALFIVRQTHRNQDTTDNIVPTIGTAPLSDYRGPICLPCDERETIDARTFYEFHLTVDEDNRLCCLHPDNDTAIHDTVLELLNLQRRQLLNTDGGHEALHWWRERNHAAHLYAKFTSKGISWTEKAHSTAFLRNLTLSDDGRHLQMDSASTGAGMYLIYSFYTFDFRAAAGDKPTGSHNLYKYRSSILGGNGELLWTAKVGGKHQQTHQTSFLCGVTYMNPKDKIEVEAVTDVGGKQSPYHVDHKPFSHFFGMFKIIEYNTTH